MTAGRFFSAPCASGCAFTAVESVQNETDYTPVQADLGKYLTVTVSRAGNTGSKTSPAMAKVAGADAAAPTVSGVTVSPKTADVQKGGTLQFSASVTGTGLDGDPAYKAVT